MKNTLYFDADFNFLLLECEESESNSIYINLHTSEATNQTLKITVGDNPAQTESLESAADVNFNLSQSLWQQNGATFLQLINHDATSAVVQINFGKITTISAALNIIDDVTFEMRYAGQEEEAGGGDSGGATGGFDFVEIIRNIMHRLLDEPSATEGAYDPFAQVVKIKWTDPDDITTDEPVPATWAGTVVVRKDGSAPLHRWDGVVEIVDTTTRDEYSGDYLVDNTAEEGKTYYYGIFPYDTRGWYRYTKVMQIETKPIPAPKITSLRAPRTTVFIAYNVSPDYTWDSVLLVYKKNAEPGSISDGTAVDIAGTTETSVENMNELTLYYFKIYAVEHITGRTFESTARAIRTGESAIRYPSMTEIVRITKGGGEYFDIEEVITITKL